MDNFALRPKLFIGTTNETSCILMSQSKLTNNSMSLNLIHLSGGNVLMDQRPKTFIQFSLSFSTSPNLNLNMNILHPGRLTWNLQITHLERKMILQASMIMFHVNLPGCNACNDPNLFQDVFFSNLGIAPNQSLPHEGILDVIHLPSSLPSLFFGRAFFFNMNCVVSQHLYQNISLYIYMYTVSIK